MSTKNITIAGRIFTVAQPYAPGPIELTEGEAAALNQVRAENIRNNMATKVKEATVDLPEDADAPQEIVDAVAAYDAEYVFALRAAGAPRETDPVQSEARKIARVTLTAAMKNAGKTRKDYSEDAYDAMLDKVAASEQVQKAAAKAVRERSKLAEDAMAGIEL